jgi:hypothetical protein
MNEIQRWGISHIHQEEFKSDTGRYVLYTDVLATLQEHYDVYKAISVALQKMLAEKEARIKELESLVDGATVVVELWDRKEWSKEWLKRAKAALTTQKEG